MTKNGTTAVTDTVTISFVDPTGDIKGGMGFLTHSSDSKERLKAWDDAKAEFAKNMGWTNAPPGSVPWVDAMNRLGQQGWEMVSFTPMNKDGADVEDGEGLHETGGMQVHMVFKRPVP